MVAWRLKVREHWPVAAGLLAIGLAWEAAIVLLHVKPYVLPSLSAIAGATATNLPVLLTGLMATLSESLGGFVLGTLIGLALAMLLVLVPLLEKALMPIVVAINSVPVVAYTPLALIWLGIGPASKVAMVTLAVGFVILLNALHGLKRPEQAAIDLMRSFGAGPLTIMAKLRLPAAMPSLVNGMRVGVVRSVIVAIVSEMLGAYRGIGWIIFQATQQVNFLEVWAAVLVSSLASMALYMALVWADRKLVWWT
jgi:NitT/TauT family transport system permease protein